jgi:hypothetical protein
MMALTLRRTWSDSPHPKEDWLVLDDGVVVGRIYENESAAPAGEQLVLGAQRRRGRGIAARHSRQRACAVARGCQGELA